MQRRQWLTSLAGRLWVIVGPTAAGKSAVALILARQLQGEIVVGDSRQLYHGLPVGTSQPTPAECAQVPHYLVGFLDSRERFSAAEYAKRARQALADIQARGHVPIVVGGTGLYIRSLLRGLTPLPPRDLRLRRRLTEEARLLGSAELHHRLAAVDAAAAERIHPHNLPRIIRALEVYQLTGKPLSWWHQLEQGSEISRPSIHSVTTPSPCLIGLRWDRRQLATRITARTHWMLTHGMIEETNALLDEGVPPEAPVFEGLGYRHIVAYLHGTLTREALEPLIVRDTVQYAKRQMTWFRKEPGIRWLDVQEPFDAHAMAQRCLELGKRSWG